MSLRDWLASRWIVEHEPSAGEIAALFDIVDRDLADASLVRLSSDARLAIAHNAALTLGTIALAASGYRMARDRAHERTLLSLKDTVGLDRKTVDLLDTVRRKRNLISYEHAGTTSAAEVNELYGKVLDLRADVVRWLRKHHSSLVPPGIKP